ncbi:MAG: hypothetical protein JWR80_319 [Bradyrhizobium sp.]|nr:hypothetical protein [Bradyrhizobium sp.]
MAMSTGRTATGPGPRKFNAPKASDDLGRRQAPAEQGVRSSSPGMSGLCRDDAFALPAVVHRSAWTSTAARQVTWRPNARVDRVLPRRLTASAGDLATHLFEITDTNGIAGHRAGHDRVIKLQGCGSCDHGHDTTCLTLLTRKGATGDEAGIAPVQPPFSGSRREASNWRGLPHIELI